MLEKFLTLSVRGLVRGPAKSWVFTSGALALLRLVRKETGRRELVDISGTKPGDKIVIEHLSVTHKQQMKDEKRRKKADKRAKKDLKKAAKAAKHGG